MSWRSVRLIMERSGWLWLRAGRGWLRPPGSRRRVSVAHIAAKHGQLVEVALGEVWDALSLLFEMGLVSARMWRRRGAWLRPRVGRARRSRASAEARAAYVNSCWPDQGVGWALSRLYSGAAWWRGCPAPGAEGGP